MWTCIKCRQTVDDQYAVCPHCGAARSAGRFSRGIQPGQTPRAQYLPEGAPVRAGRGYILFGMLLTLLIPALILFLSIVCRKYLQDELSLILHPNVLNIAVDNWKIKLVYWLCAAACILLSALPGLWTIGIGTALRRLGRIEEKL